MSTKPIVLNGKAYRSIEDMPPEVREKYELALCLLGDPEEEFIPGKFKSKNRLASEAKNLTAHAVVETPPRSGSFEPIPSARTSRDKSLSSDALITSDSPNSWMLAMAFIFLCLTGTAGGWYFFLR